MGTGAAAALSRDQAEKSLRDDILTGFAELIEEVTGVKANTVNHESHLVDDLGLDSLDAVEIANMIENRYRVELPDDELIRIRSVKDAENFVLEIIRDHPEAAREFAKKVDDKLPGLICAYTGQ